ncbi:hypothetical protein JCM25156A_28960 [Komagataeibacter kakiaceti JCM 25156]
MEINAGNINALTTRITWRSTAPVGRRPDLSEVSMVIPSTSGSNFYPRLAELPGLREWKGSRVVHRLSVGGRMQIINRKFEETLSISRDDLDDDDYGMLMPVVEELGSDAGSLPDKLVYEQLGKGRTELCMDGQPYFDKDHPPTTAMAICSLTPISTPSRMVSRPSRGGMCLTQAVR